MADRNEVKRQESGEVSERTDRKVYVPQTDIYETEDSLVLTADMPGVDEKNIDIDLEDSILTITGKTEDPKIWGNAVLTEYEAGDYKRSFTLSNEIDTAKIDASIKDGVLRLVLPKSAGAKPKKIEVKAG